MKKKLSLVLIGVLLSGVSLVQAGGFEDWCAMYGISADPTDDPDMDGANNLLEYAFGGNPTNAAEVGTSPILEEDGEYYLHLIYAMRNEDPELTYTIYENADPEFASWSLSERWSLYESVGMSDPEFILVTKDAEINFSQMTFVVEVEQTDTNGVGSIVWSEEMAYPVAGSGGNYELTVVSGSGSGSYSMSDIADIIADTPAEGMMFYRWVGDTGLLSGSRYSPTSSIDFDYLTTMGYIFPPMSVDLEATYRAIQLSSLAVSGSSPVNSGSTNSYVCTANYTDGSHSNVTGSAQWSVSGTVATIEVTGTLIAGQVAIQEQVTVSASYTDGGITKADTFNVVVQNSNMEWDYSYIGGSANPLILSNQVFIGTSGNDAAEIGQIAALEVYDCTFHGGEEGGTGFAMQEVNSIFITTALPDYEAKGGDGGSVDNQTQGADVYVRGGIGVSFEAAANIVIENMNVIGGNGGEIQAYDEFVGTGSVAGGDGIIIADNTGNRTIRIDDGSYAGGYAGGILGMSSSSLEGMGGNGATILGHIGGGELVISNGVFSGGSGGFLMDSGGNADGGDGVFVNQQATTIFGGTFSGASSGLGSSVNGGHGVYVSDSDIEISGGIFIGGAGYDATYAGSGVRLENSLAVISAGDFAGEEYGGKLSAGLRVENSSANISGGDFDSICFASGSNGATLSGTPMIETLLQIDGASDVVLSGFSGLIETVQVEGGTMTVSGDTWMLVSGSEIKITEVATLLVGELQTLSGSQITTEIGATFAGTNLTFESGCDWTIDVNGAGVTGIVELATASGDLVSNLNASDITVLGGGTTYASGIFSSNSTLYVTIEEIPVGFDAWTEGVANVNLRGHADSPDGDGVANLLKYACGFPSGFIVSNLFDYDAFSATPTNSAYITITYRKAKNLSDANVYPVWAGSLMGDGSQWTTNGIDPWKSGEDGEQEIWKAWMLCVSNSFLRLEAELK